MELTTKEFWTALHGMIFGAGFLLTFSGAFVALWGLRSDCVTAKGARGRLRIATISMWSMVFLAWTTVLLGTYVIYPWYRAKPPGPSAVLADYPKFLLKSNPRTADWHEFGMEWKEHIAWLVPILATAVAFVVTRHGRRLLDDRALRRAVLVLFSISFFCATVAGLLGAFINKAAPTR
jgi:hypothetical protein